MPTLLLRGRRKPLVTDEARRSRRPVEVIGDLAPDPVVPDGLDANGLKVAPDSESPDPVDSFLDEVEAEVGPDLGVTVVEVEVDAVVAPGQAWEEAEPTPIELQAVEPEIEVEPTVPETELEG